MGLLSTVKTLLKSWSGEKRKREDDDCAENQQKVKRARVNSYTLTPVAKTCKEAELMRRHNHYYDYNEEVKSTETRTVEFKQGGVLFNHHKFMQLIQKYGPAFLNCEGGVLLAGVTDDGRVKGLSISSKEENNIKLSVKNEINRFRPIVTSDLWSIDFVPVAGTGNSRLYIPEKLVVEICFKKGSIEKLYENGEHQVFLRRDGGVQGPLRPLDIKNLVIARYNETLKLRRNQVERGDLSTLEKTSTGCLSTKKKSVKLVVDPKKDAEAKIVEYKPTETEQQRRERLAKKGIKLVDYDSDFF